MTTSLLRSSRIFSVSQQRYCLRGIDSSTDFHFRLSLSKARRTIPGMANIIRITVTFRSLSFSGSLLRSFISILWNAGSVNATRRQVLFFWLINTLSSLLSGIGSVRIWKSYRVLYAKFLTWIQVCAYATWYYDQILISCIIPSGSPLLPFCTSFLLVRRIHLLWD